MPRASSNHTPPASPLSRLPCALTIAGLDPGGGAGIAADLRAFRATGVMGCAAASLVTVQSTAGMRAMEPVRATLLEAQVTEVIAHQNVRAIKVGALGTAANVRAVARILVHHAHIPSIVDTVMLPTRGKASLLGKSALGPLRSHLLPAATVVTVNAPEASVLTGARVRCVEDAMIAAESLAALGPRVVVVKGGHLDGPTATDIVAVQRSDGTGLQVSRLDSPRVAGAPTHGGGCVLASLIAGRIAFLSAPSGGPGNDELVAAVRWAKRRMARAFKESADVGGPLRVFPL